ncbi:MAG: hypothetical protein IPJ81_17475 [Chitinophagaceae bacterium]|nr:hypothetical protein [Chitinophagaceae bacterium]
MQPKYYIKNYLIGLILLSFSLTGQAQQSDSTIQTLQRLPVKYLTKIDDKIDKYSSRITTRTQKALEKLSRWEGKIQKLLNKVNPEAAQRLFGNDQTTFTTLLNKIKEGKTIAGNYQAQYNEYRDKLTSSLGYLEQQKESLDKQLMQPLSAATKKLDALEQDIQNSEALEAFIKERKGQLIDESLQYIGKSKYLQKIDKESYYYIETIKNYKQLFSEPKKAEELALKILNKIPAFTKFLQQNSQLASMFRMPGAPIDPQSLAGLQTRSSINALIQDRIASAGPNAQAQIAQNIQQAQAQIQQLQDKILQSGQSSSTDELPNFKPNNQKTKTFKQRLEFGNNFQFGKNNSYLPTTADIGLSVGYKINDKSIIGIGASYKLGLGSIQRISITHQGIGLRSFVDWKLKKQFFISGGYEMNYQAQFKNIAQLNNYNSWQSSGLIGLSKKIKVQTKWYKGSTIQILYDMLSNRHIPVSQPFIFRVGTTL